MTSQQLRKTVPVGTRITEAFLRFNEWTPARKILLVGLIWLSAHVGFALIIPSTFVTEGGAMNSNVLMPILWKWILVQVIALGIVATYVNRNSASMFPVYIYMYSYGTLMVAYMYLMGLAAMFIAFPFILAAGYMTIFGFRGSIPLFGYIFLLMLTVALAQYQGHIPVAPIMSDISRETLNDARYMSYGILWVVASVLIVATLIGLTAMARDYAQNALARSNQLIRRYAPPAVAERIIAGEEATVDTPQRRRVTVLFSDISNFTEVADRVDPESIAEIINEYMSTMADTIDAHHGTLNEFAGDGLMALYGAPDDMAPEDQARRAIATARDMQAHMPELNRRWRKLGISQNLNIRVGINTGVLSVGSFGSQGRMTYTAIGLQTNLTARIESHCEAGGILISDATYQLICEEMECKPVGEVECKGVHFPVKVYAVT